MLKSELRAELLEWVLLYAALWAVLRLLVWVGHRL